MLFRLRALIIKELLALLRDPKGRMVLIMPPLLQLVIFSFAATLDVENVSVAVLNQDTGVWSREMIQRLESAGTFSRIEPLTEQRQIAPIIDRREVLLVVRIGSGFSARIEAGGTGQVQMVLDGRRSNAAQIVQGYVATIIDRLNTDITARQGATPTGQVAVLERSWFNPNLDYQWFTVPSLVAMITMLIGVLVTALSVARERELGTFDQLLVSPYRPMEILIGKTVPSLLIGLTHATLFIVVAVTVFHIPFTGSLPMLYASMVVYLSAVIGIGLFISSISMTQQQAILGAFLFTAPAILLSGFATPVENMPGWLQDVTVVNPLRHFLVIVRGVFLKDMPAASILDNTLPLVLIAAVTLTAAAWMFRRRLG